MLSRHDLLQIGRGFLMGGADIIPGVSGGTVALILGIYQRLVTGVSRFDTVLIEHLRNRQWRRAAEHVDLRFLLTLGCGIVCGIVGLASVMHYLLNHQLQYTFAAFFGLILASSLLVGRMVERWTAGIAGGLLAGAGFAYWLVGLPFSATPPEGNLYIFFCGVIGICAMILPGISGAFILLVMGKYAEITGLLRNVLHGQFVTSDLLSIAVFCSGCVVGLLSFSKALRWLLARHESQTMALLCGFMLGSLRKIWPFKLDLTPSETEFKLKQFRNVLPDHIDGNVILTLLIAAAAAVVIMFLDRITHTSEHAPLEESPAEPQSQHVK